MTHSSSASCRIGIDVGGTFTDFVLANQATGQILRHKEPSVPADPSMSIERGVPKLLEMAGVTAGDVELIVHGTTLALNATIQRKGSRLGLVVSRGLRGVLEIARSQMPTAFDFMMDREEPLVPRSLVREIGARSDRDGNVLIPIDAAELDALAAAYAEAGVEAVTVMLMHSFANPALEHEVVAELQARLPGIAVSASSDIWPEQREFERAMVALLNSYTQPLMNQYFDRLAQRVATLGVAAPIYITSNNGGILSLETARQRPIDTILSGPASGVVAAMTIAQQTGEGHIITVDMGGTSADMAMVHDGRSANTTHARVGDFPLVMPIIGVNAIGAGGGSVVWVDEHGMLKIGPHSAGAHPGPICYGNGGTDVTITDCFLVAGYLDADNFLGGRVKLQRDLARAALAGIATRLGYEGEAAPERVAEAALRVAAAVMASEMSRELAQHGGDVRDYSLLAFGGAGPTTANLVADEAGIRTLIVPALPATFCALGAILADVKRDYVVSRRLLLESEPGALAELDAIFTGLESEAGDWIAGEGDFLETVGYEYILDMRYVGQGFDLSVTLPASLRQALDTARVREVFEAAHLAKYGYSDDDSAIIVNAERVRVVGTVPSVPMPRTAQRDGPATASGSRQVFNDGRLADVPVYRRQELLAGQFFTGPALVEQNDTTIWILPGWHCTVDLYGNLVARQNQS